MSTGDLGGALPVSVVIPTIGRPALLRGVLESLAACDPRAGEVVVVDQSHDPAVAELVDAFAGIGARLVPCEGTGEARARNEGLTAAAHELVLWTDDDCTVAPDWVGAAWRHMQADPSGVLTGRVLPAGDPLFTPSTRDHPAPRTYTGTRSCSALDGNNFVVPRSSALDLGGFDERLPYAVDCDFCYRWLRAGRALRYVPDLVVWHHDWRTPDELKRVYQGYAEGQGMFYAKHLRAGDRAVLRFIAQNLSEYARSLAVGVVRRRPAWSDWRRAIPRGLPRGLAKGWRATAPADRDRFPPQLRRVGYAMEAWLGRLGERWGVDWLVYNPITLAYYQLRGEMDAPGAIRALSGLFPAAGMWLDAGAGSGVFAAEAQRRSRPVVACEYTGLGRWMARRQGVDCRPFDLRREPPAILNGPFALAYCFEVAEHVEPAAGDRLVAFLAEHARMVAFTAAPPGQGGAGHVNEQPKSYWIQRFDRRGMRHREDLSRRLSETFAAEGVQSPWLIQNVMVFERR